MKCSIYDIGFLEDYKYVITFALSNDKWVFCKHKKRNTWEASGGHIEKGETPIEAAKRELYEETGALKFDIKPICDYWACDEPHETKNITWANGMVFFAKVHLLGKIPDSEMEEVGLFSKLPDNLTYKDIMQAIFPHIVKSVPIRF